MGVITTRVSRDADATATIQAPSRSSVPPAPAAATRTGLGGGEIHDAIAVAAPQRTAEQQQITSSRLSLGLSPRPAQVQVMFAAKKDARSPKTQPRIIKPAVKLLE